MDVRKAQDAKRNFGAAPTAAWQAFRKVGDGPQKALAFVKSTPASTFYPHGPMMPRESDGKTSTTKAKQ
jgi:hypothetical protein